MRRVRALQTRAVRGLAAGTIALGLVGACGDATDGTPATTNEDLPDTGHDVEADASTTAVEDPEGSGGSGAAAPADTDGGESTDGTDSTDGDTGEPEPNCTIGTCQTTCTGWDTVELRSGTCSCESEPRPPGYMGCDLPEPCFAGDTVCMIESIRDGVVGRYRLEPATNADAYLLDIEVFAPGRARAHEFGWTHDCCGGAGVNEYGRRLHVQDIVPADDPSWDDCLASLDELDGALPSCLDPEVLFLGVCEPVTAECPSVD